MPAGPACFRSCCPPLSTCSGSGRRFTRVLCQLYVICALGSRSHSCCRHTSRGHCLLWMPPLPTACQLLSG